MSENKKMVIDTMMFCSSDIETNFFWLTSARGDSHELVFNTAQKFYQ
jgi:hypothetical protein